MNELTAQPLSLPRVVAHRSGPRPPGRAGTRVHGGGAFLFTGGLLPLLRLEGGVDINDLEGDPLMQSTWLAIYGVTLTILGMRAQATLQLLGRERWLMLLCRLAAEAVIWSDAPGVTFRRTVAPFGTTAFGVYLASRYTVGRIAPPRQSAAGHGCGLQRGGAGDLPYRRHDGRRRCAPRLALDRRSARRGGRFGHVAPVAGAGYSAFWLGWHGESAAARLYVVTFMWLARLHGDDKTGPA